MPCHVRLLVLCPVVAALAGFHAPVAAADFQPLFDGKSLAGWQGDPEIWSVKDGQIVGSTEAKPIKKNSFLSTKKKYKNFELKAKFKLRNGNSGIQIRSAQHPDHVVKGYQADIAEKRYMGILYEEGGRGILADVQPEEVEKHIKPGEWNEYLITVDGPRIVQKINGFTAVDYTEKSDVGAKEGIIALQVHVGPAMQVMFKDVEIRELP
ncbi:MAG: DUF1080 domain-containing protein [Planctomycetaceae bacterium]|nr:DUF1080 domain-containing protein [Planctomycetaceae bacterium]